MIESIFVIMLMFTLLINIMGFIIGKKSMLGIVFLMISVIMWLSMIMTNSLYVVVPGDTSYQEYGLNIFCTLWIFIDICFLVYFLISSEGFKNWHSGRNHWRG